MKGFSEKEKKQLQKCAKRAIAKKEKLVDVFSDFAKKTRRASGSVRNYYYKAVASGEFDGLCARKIQPFTSTEELKLIRAVLGERLKTRSVRQAIKNLAGGDEKLAGRYQNKFRNMLKKQRAAVMREVLLQKQKNGACFNPFAYKCAVEINAKAAAEGRLLRQAKESANKAVNAFKKAAEAVEKQNKNANDTAVISAEKYAVKSLGDITDNAAALNNENGAKSSVDKTQKSSNSVYRYFAERLKKNAKNKNKRA